MKNNIVEGYVLPDNAEIKEVDVKMWSNGISPFGFTNRRLAAYNCAVGSVCACGATYDGKTYTMCPECRTKKSEERYNKLELVEWDGVTPLSLFDGDEYFFSEEDIESYLDGEENNLQLVLCEKTVPPTFSLDDFLEDYVPEDGSVEDLETDESCVVIEKVVNDYLSKLSDMWYPSNKRVNI